MKKIFLGIIVASSFSLLLISSSITVSLGYTHNPEVSTQQMSAEQWIEEWKTLDKSNQHCLQEAVAATQEVFNDVASRVMGITALAMRTKPRLKENDPIIIMDFSLAILHSMTEALQQMTRSIQNIRDLCVEANIDMPTKRLLNNLSSAIMSNMPITESSASENPEQLMNIFLHIKSRIELLLDEMKRA